MKKIAFIALFLACISPHIMPVIAADYTLGIFGNANMDDTIARDDVEYVQGIIDGTNEVTELADANYDGQIDEEDITQIEAIIRGEENELTIVDSAESAVTIKKPVQRIVIGSSYYGETILYILDVEEKIIVGVEDAIKTKGVLLPQLSEKESVGTVRSDPDIEKILELDPEIVFTYVNSPKPELLEDKLEGTGIKVVRMDLWRMATLRDEIVKLGYIFGKQDNANKYLEFHDEIVGYISEQVSRIPDDERPKVYVDASAAEGPSDRKTRNAPDGVHQLCENAGGKNIASDLSTSNPAVSAEWVLTQNPDVIFGCSFGMEGGYGTADPIQLKDHYDGIMALPGSEDIVAVKNNRVQIISNDLAFGPDYFIALSYMAKLFHPAIFEDINPEEIHQDFLNEFYSDIDFDVSKQGAFVYPEPS